MKIPETKIDNHSLRESAKDPDEFRLYVKLLEESLASVESATERVGLLGELGVRLRTMEELDRAESVLNEALEIVRQENLGLAREVQQKIRLAHVLQWKKDFIRSNALFDAVLDLCLTRPEAERYLDFALQHAGKNMFDQNRFREARELFERALEIRKVKNSPQDQIASTLQALDATKRRLGLG